MPGKTSKAIGLPYRSSRPGGRPPAGHAAQRLGQGLVVGHHDPGDPQVPVELLQQRVDARRRSGGRGCRWARRPAAGAAGGPGPAPAPPAAARPRRAPRGGARPALESPTRSRLSSARRRMSARGEPPDQAGHHGVLERGELGQEVVALEDEPHRLVAEARQLALVERGQVARPRTGRARRWGRRARPPGAGRCSCPRRRARSAPPSRRPRCRGSTPCRTSQPAAAGEVGLRAGPRSSSRGGRLIRSCSPSTGSSRAARVAG